VPISEAAIGEHIVNPAPTTASEGPKILIVKGRLDQIVHLDLHHLRNVVYVNMTIVYDGGPVILENVSFVNCQFRLAQQQRCVSFGESLFASNPVNFKTSG